MRKLIESLALQVVCPFGSWIAAGSLALGAIGQLSGDKAAQTEADASKRHYSQLDDMSLEQYNLWKQNGLPLLKSLGDQAQEDRTGQETDLATGAVKDQFATARANARRALNLTGGDQTDRAAAVLAPSYMDEAAHVSGAITDARRSEQLRRFNEGSQVSNIWNKLPAQALQGVNAAASGEGRLAGTYGDIANNNAAGYGQIGYSTAVLGRNANRWFGGGDGGGNPAMNYNTDGTVGNPTSFGDTYSLSDPAYGADGGVLRGRRFERRGYADGGDVPNGGGVIKGPGTGTSDSVAMKARPGSFILSADTVRAIGHKKVHDFIEKAGVRPGEGGGSYSGVPIRASNGEAEIPPEAVRYHGEDFFHKLQQKYHRPVMQDDDGHANGGVIKKRGLPKSVEDAIFRSMPNQALGRRN